MATNMIDDAVDPKELNARFHHNAIWLLFVNGYAAFIVFVQHLITLESLLSILLSISLTVFLYLYTDDETFNGGSLNWVLLSFAVVTPISSSIAMAFQRREQALRSIGTLRATLMEVYIAHSIWDWGSKSKSSISPSVHAEKVYIVIMDLQKTLSTYLTLPNHSRARHRTTHSGKKEAREIGVVSEELHESIVQGIVRLGELCEDIKKEGLPGNEASRIRQWEHGILSEVEHLRNIKRYRTPQGLRSFGRVFSVFAPPFYSPYYSDLARQLDSLGMGIAFSVLTAVALTSLFETVSSLEDPFIEKNFLDGVNVEEELVTSFESLLLARRKYLFPE